MNRNSKIYLEQEADNYVKRNLQVPPGKHIKHLTQIFDLREKAVAELGIGHGVNLQFMKERGASIVDGYEGSKEGVRLAREKGFRTKEVNLAEPFKTYRKYDLVLMGFYCYYLSDEELKPALKNVLGALKKDSYVFFWDFLTLKNIAKPDKRNPELTVYKRNLAFWLDYFKDFTLTDFKLFRSETDIKDADAVAPVSVPTPVPIIFD